MRMYFPDPVYSFDRGKAFANHIYIYENIFKNICETERLHVCLQPISFLNLIPA